MYTNYQYYVDGYGGSQIPEEAFPKAERWAEAYIRKLTYTSGDIFSEPVDLVKAAVCAAAEAYYICEQRNAAGGAVKAETNDGYSVSFSSEQTDGQTVEALIRQKAYAAVSVYLLPTGWMSRKVGCVHDYKCCCDHL